MALKKNRIKVVSATEMITDTPEGALLESVLEGIAQYYSELSVKVVRGLTENALKCKYNGGTLPIGYVVDSEQFYQVDPLTAPAVIEAFQHYANGIPAIVSQDLFDRVQERMASNKKAPAKHKAEDEYLLTTKLFCGKCQCFMVGESGTSHTGFVHRYYKCVSVKNHKGCDKKSVQKDFIENLVIEQIKKLIFDDELIEKLTDTVMELQGKENTAPPLLRKQYADT